MYTLLQVRTSRAKFVISINQKRKMVDAKRLSLNEHFSVSGGVVLIDKLRVKA